MCWHHIKSFCLIVRDSRGRPSDSFIRGVRELLNDGGFAAACFAPEPFTAEAGGGASLGGKRLKLFQNNFHSTHALVSRMLMPSLINNASYQL